MRSFRFWPDKAITAEKRLIDANGHKIPILILKRKDHTGNAPGILWFHGGGYATGIKEMVYIGRAESLVKKYGADAGIMISASHNSYEFNGIKLFDKNGYKLPDETENKIEKKKVKIFFVLLLQQNQQAS